MDINVLQEYYCQIYGFSDDVKKGLAQDIIESMDKHLMQRI